MIQGAVRLAPSQLLVSWIPLSNISRMTRFPLTCCPLMIKFVGHRNRNRALQSTWVRTSGSRNQRIDSRTERVLRLGITPIQRESQLSEHRELYPHVSARRWEAIRVSGYRAHGVVIWQIDVVNIADDEAKKSGRCSGWKYRPKGRICGERRPYNKQTVTNIDDSVPIWARWTCDWIPGRQYTHDSSLIVCGNDSPKNTTWGLCFPRCSAWEWMLMCCHWGLTTVLWWFSSRHAGHSGIWKSE